MVSYLTNSIVDQILQELYTSHKTLVLVITPFCMTSSGLELCFASARLRRRTPDGSPSTRRQRHFPFISAQLEIQSEC